MLCVLTALTITTALNTPCHNTPRVVATAPLHVVRDRDHDPSPPYRQPQREEDTTSFPTADDARPPAQTGHGGYSYSDAVNRKSKKGYSSKRGQGGYLGSDAGKSGKGHGYAGHG